MSGGRRIAVLADHHIPFMDKRADAVARKVLAAFDPQLIWIAGDLLDFAPISRFRDASRYEHTLQDELDEAATYLASLRKAHPKAEMAYQLGNHEQRLRSYILANADQLDSLRGLKLAGLLGLDTLDVTLVEGRRYVAGGTFCLKHGTRYGEYAIKAELLTEGRDGMCGHNHRNAMWSRTTHGRRPLTWWHVGPLCKTEPEYMRQDDQVANWQQGQAFITEHPARAAVELVSIHRGVAYWRGKRYEA
jgi:hypothetical protein